MRNQPQQINLTEIIQKGNYNARQRFLDTTLMRNIEATTGVGFYEISESTFDIPEEILSVIDYVTIQSHNYHQCLNQLYHIALINQLNGIADETDLMVIRIFEHGLSSRMIQLQRARRDQIPLLARDDLLIGTDGRIYLGESEAAKISGIGYLGIMGGMLEAEGIDASSSMLFYRNTAEEITRYMELTNAQGPLVIILSDNYDQFHRADIATMFLALREFGVDVVGIRESNLELSDDGILLPAGDISNTILAFPSAEEIAKGHLPLTRQTDELAILYEKGTINCVIPPKPFLGNKVGRALLSDPRIIEKLTRFTNQAGISIEEIQSVIPESKIISVESNTNIANLAIQLSEYFLKDPTASGDGGVVGPGLDKMSERITLLQRSRQTGTPLVAETCIETQTFDINREGNTIQNGYLRLSVFRNQGIRGGAVATIRPNNAHVHLTSDASSLPVNYPLQERIGVHATKIIPYSDEQLGEIFPESQSLIDIVREHDLQEYINYEHIEQLRQEDGSIFGRPSQIFHSRNFTGILKNLYEEDVTPNSELHVIQQGIGQVIKIFSSALSQLARDPEIANLIFVDPDLARDRGNIRFRPEQFEILQSVFAYLVDIQKFNTSRNLVLPVVEKQALLERLIIKAIKREPVEVVTGVCPGYTVDDNGAYLRHNIDPKSIETLLHMQRVFRGNEHLRFQVRVLFSGHKEIIDPAFMKVYKGNIDEDIAAEYRAYGDLLEMAGMSRSQLAFFGDLISISEMVEMAQGELAEILQIDSDQIDDQTRRQLSIIIKGAMTGSLEGRLFESEEEFITSALNDARIYAAAGILFSRAGIDLYAATEGPIRSRFITLGTDLNNSETPTLPYIYAGGDNSIHFKR